MIIPITSNHILRLAPNSQSNYRQAFEDAQTIFDRFEISTNQNRLVHFMAQVLHETSGLTVYWEDLDYSADRLPKVWPSRFKPRGMLDAVDYAHNPKKLADAVYGTRMGNSLDEGFLFRGRGLLQTTGRAGYERVTQNVRAIEPTSPDFTESPDLVIDQNWCVLVAVSEWVSLGCNSLADADDLRGVTRAINGGLTGIAERTEWAKRARAVWPSP
jgi:putative chitinase